MSEIYDIAILGAGPAGISAVIYAARARLKILWLDKQFTVGGQIQNTYEVDNYPGLPGISGMDLGEAFENHAQKLGVSPVRENVLAVEDTGEDHPYEKERIQSQNCSACLRSQPQNAGDPGRAGVFRNGSFLLCNL